MKTAALLAREFDAICRQLRVTAAEMRFGRQRRRTARLVTAARGLFMLRAKKLGATSHEIAEMLEMNIWGVRAWLREFRDRGLIPDSRESDQLPCQDDVKTNAKSVQQLARRKAG